MSDLTCTHICYYCSGTKVASDNTVHKAKECSVYDSNYSSNDDLQCSADATVCYRCIGNTPTKISIQSGECSDYDGYVTESKKGTLQCTTTEDTTTKIKCCACKGTKRVETREVDDGEECPENETVCSEIICDNSQTGSTTVIVAWIIGLAAIGYAFYYFRGTNKQY